MVHKGILTKKQSDGGYFMYFAPNVRAFLRGHVIRFARSAQKFILWVEKKKRFVKRGMRKLQKTTLWK